jgi:DNA (cytosine-5)-methyltransferase 1
VRTLLNELGPRDGLGPHYVIENVEGSPLHHPVTLCGAMFRLSADGYKLRRHRLFETTFPINPMPVCRCSSDYRPVLDVSGGGPTHAPRLDGGGGRTYKGTVAQKRAIMGIDWMTGSEIVEAVPPAYTYFIGRRYLAALQKRAA